MYTLDKATKNFNMVYHACKSLLLKKDPRDHVTHVMVKNGVLHATDGRALVVCNVTETMKDGFYRPILIKKACIIFESESSRGSTSDFNDSYPDVSGITEQEYPNMLSIDWGFENHLCAFIAINTGIPLSDTYTQIAARMETFGVEFTRDVHNKAVKFTCSATGCLYVMPIKI